MVFKTWLIDINKVALAMDGLKGIRIAGTINKLNPKSLNAFVKGIDGLTLSQAQAALSTKALTDKQKEQILVSAGLLKTSESVTASEIKQTVAENILTAEKQQEILAIFELEMAEGKLTWERLEAIATEDSEAGAIARLIVAKKGENAQNLKNIASGKALTAVLKEQLLALATNPMTWVVAGLVGVATVAYQCSQAIEEVEESAQELNGTFSTSKTEIEDYKTQIEDLYKIINDSGSSIEDVTTARQNLMTVQDQLIEKFGDEKDAINLITDAINGQTEALDILTQSQWQATKNEFNASGGFWGGVANFFGGYSNNIDRMIGEYEDYELKVDFSRIGNNNLDTDEYVQLRKQLEEVFGAKFTDDAWLFTLSGNASEIYEQLLEIQNITKDYNLGDASDNYLTELANDARDTEAAYKDFYNQYILYEKIFTDGTLTESYKEINDAYLNYQNAFSTGNDNFIKDAQENFAKVLTEATNGLTDEGVVDYFNNMYPDLQEVVGSWQFETNFTTNTEGLKDEIYNTLNTFDDFSSEDILGLNLQIATQEQIDAYNKLHGAAREYGLTLEQLIELLVQMGLIQSETDRVLEDKILSGVTSPNSSYEAKQYSQDKQKEEFYNSLDNETKNLIINAEIPEHIKTGTLKEMKAWVKELQEEAKVDIEVNATTITETVNALNTQLKPTFDDLQSAYNEIFEGDDLHLEKVSADMLAGFKSTLDELNGISGVSIDISAYEDFAKVLTDMSSTPEQVEQAFDDYATAIVNGATATNGLSEETKELTTSLLAEMGVVNANEVVESKLVEQKIDLLLSTGELTDATYDEISAFITEAGVTGQASNAMYAYAMKKIMSNANWINESNSIKNIKALAEAAGIATDAVILYQNAKLGKIKDTGAAEKIIDNFENRLNELTNVDVDCTNIDTSDNGSGSDSPFDWSDLLDKEIALLEKQLEAGLIDFDTYLDKRLDLINQYYNEGKIAADEYYSYLEDTYEHQLSIYDKVIKAVTYRIDKEIDGLEKEKESIEETYNLRIESIQSEIDALEEARKKREQQVELEKALYEVEKERSQRDIKLYSGNDRGVIYTNDSKNLRDAQEDLEDKQHELHISKLESQIESLEKEMNDATQVIDEQIERLEEYKEQWNSVAEEYENAQAEMYANGILGLNWQTEVINGNLDLLNNFKSEYIAIQQALADAAWKSANEQVKAAREAAKGAEGSTGSACRVHSDDELKKSAEKEVYVYNGKEYATKELAQNAKNADYKKLNASSGMPSNLKTQKLKEIEDREIKPKKYHTGLDQGYVGDKISLSADKRLEVLQKAGNGDLLKSDEQFSILKNKELVLTEYQGINIADTLWQNEMSKFNMPDYSHLNNIVSRNIPQPTIVNIGDIRIEGVQNVPDFARELQKHLPNISVQYNGKH